MNCLINGVTIRQLDRYTDDRGWLTELVRSDELDQGNIPMMSYISMTKPGYIRGPHEHRFQTDLFTFLGFSTFRLYLWDNRENSATFKMHCCLDFGEESLSLVIIPPGVVHGYKNIGNREGLLINSPNRLYKGEKRADEVDEIRYENDQTSGFVIPIQV